MTKSKFLKIVYFDEGSALDYLESIYGGRYDKISTDMIQKVKAIAGEVGADVATDPNILSLLVGSVFGFKGSTKGSISYDRTKDSKVNETISSTVLSNFIDEVYVNKKGNGQYKESCFGIFEKEKLSFIPNSITFLKIISPMLKILKEDSFGSEMPIQIESLDQIFNDAKGYYELVSMNNGKYSRVFRFNFNALRNNYRLNDLTKMNLTIIGIKVGECTVKELELESEFNEQKVNDYKSSFERLSDKVNETDKEEVDQNLLSVYDVILAGVGKYEN